MLPTLPVELVAEGEAKGRAEGRVEAQQSVLLRLLTLKFGDIPSTLRQRLMRASEAELDRWTESVLSASSLPEVLVE